MGVLLPNTTATIRRRQQEAENSHGERVSGELGAPVGDPLPALIEQRADGGWQANLDNTLWPVREGDRVVEAGGQQYVVRTADLLTNVYDDTVNHIRCEVLRVGTQGTEPTDSWFVGRT